MSTGTFGAGQYGGVATSVARLALPTSPGVFPVELTGLAAGGHLLRASARLHGKPWGEDRLRFVWEEASPEAPMDRKWLMRTAETTGGTMTELSRAGFDELAKRLPPVQERSEVRARHYPCSTAAWLWLTALLFLSEWGLRRWKGLP